jgi:tRNA-dependent cyclodipeptide synthase
MLTYALIAVSPFNSYYSVNTMTLLFQWAKDKYDFDVFMMDNVSKYNLMALGDSEAYATKETHK